MKKLFFLFTSVLFSCLVSSALAQETPAQPAEQPPVQAPEYQAPMYQPNAPALPRVNPAVLLKMKNDLSFELQNIQRTLGVIDPSDAELKKTLTEQQAELVNQLKDINSQLKSQGFPTENEMGTLPPGMPAPPKKNDTLMGGGQERIPSPNWAQPRTTDNPPALPAIPNGMGLPPNLPEPMPPGAMVPAIPNYTPPQPFDQDRAWGNSPWVPQPSQELTNLKQTVESLRTEITSLKETVKALETQIQLLNRNILLSQPK